jgi:isocitrate dehydrogenase kinase/phosphatase
MQAYPPGLYQELNVEMMEGLWYTIAAAIHPEVFAGNPQQCPSLQEVFDKHLADATWADFWGAFPYELRCGCAAAALGV